jgi:hypothetical protein
VVVGNAEDDPPSDVLAVGATPQLAEQIQGLAAPETVLISAATYHLVQGYFVCTPREAPRLPGAPAPTILYQVRGPGTAQGRLDLTTPPQRTPFVGREAELAVLRERATRVRQGSGNHGWCRKSPPPWWPTASPASNAAGRPIISTRHCIQS